MTLQLFFTITAVALTAVGLLVGGFWAVATLAGRQFEKRLEQRFESINGTLEELKRVGGERLARLETRYEELNKEVRQILIELPRDYVARTDYIRRETVMEGKIDLLSLRIENWMLGKKKEGNDP